MSAALALPPRDHNGPPEPTPFDLSRDEIEGLFLEAKNWLDGSGVQTQADADAVSKLLDLIRKAESRAEERRKVEVKPFDDGKAEVQGRYNPLIGATKAITGKTMMAADACKKALAPFLRKQDDKKRAKAEAERKAADEAARKAQEALRASAVTDLAAREEAETLARAAKVAEATAKRAENDKAAAKGGTRAVGLVTTYRTEVTDPAEFARWACQNRRDEVRGMFQTFAERLCSSGLRTMPGVTVHEERVAR